MPLLTWVNGLKIAMHYADHNPPHVHIAESGSVASLAIKTGEVLKGNLSRNGLRMARKWVDSHGEQLLEAWSLAEKKLPLPPMEHWT